LQQARVLDRPGRLAEQRAALDDAIACAVAADDPGQEARARMSIAFTHLFRGQHGPAEESFALAVELALRGNDRGTEAEARALKGHLLDLRGCEAEAHALFERAPEPAPAPCPR